MQRMVAMLVIALLMACSNPVIDEVMELEGELEGEGKLMIMDWETFTAVRYWEVLIPSRHILAVGVKLENGLWKSASYVMSNTGACLFVFRITDMAGEGTQYRIEYRK